MDRTSPQVSVADIENVLCQIGEVKAARVVASPSGQIEEVHVLAFPTKSPKQLVRDVESTIMASFGISMDHKRISIAQLGTGEMPKADNEAPPRAKIKAINTELHGTSASAVVTLDLEDETYVGKAEGPASETGRQRLVAQATLNAIEQYAHAEEAFALEDVAVVQLGHQQVAVCCVVLVTPLGEQAFTGSALVRQNEKDSICRATLGAVNRRVGFLTTS